MTDDHLFALPEPAPDPALMRTKKCAECSQVLPVTDFYRQRNHKPNRRTGDWKYSYRCKPCTRTYQNANSAKHRVVEKVLPAEKLCRVCDVTKPANGFARNRSRWDGLQERCLDCYRDNRYGLALGQYDAMLAAQGGGCAICGGTKSYGRGLAVDHCHATGRVRGLLCTNCNSGLGMFQDSPALMATATSYLRRAHRT